MDGWADRRCPSGSPHSLILDDGRYAPGKKGHTKLREKKTDGLFERHPELQRRFAEDPASWQFYKRQLLRFQDKMADGFRARYSRELLLVDARTDASLACFLQHLRASLPPASVPTKERVRALSMAVVDAFGGSEAGVSNRHDTRLKQLRLEPPADLPIGELMGGPCVAHRRAGAGVCRHRAILLKYACDVLGLVECALLTGVMVPAGTHDVRGARGQYDVDHMWNVVRIDGSLSLVDSMFFPGELFAAEDLFRAIGGVMEYHRIGGQAGVLSLDREASRSRTAGGGQGAAASYSFFLHPELGAEDLDEADPVAGVEDGDEDEFFAVLQKVNLEQLGDVEVQRWGPLQCCAACGVDVEGLRVRPRGCHHTFHAECLLGSWESGQCPVCHCSFAY